MTCAEPRRKKLQPLGIKANPVRCNAGMDGECLWEGCPQLRDNEPHATGRHCPIDVRDDDELADEAGR